MSLKLYMDHNVRQEIIHGLRRRGVDVLTAFEDGADRLPDPQLLDRATALGRVLVSRDEDLIREAIRRRAVARNLPGSSMRIRSGSRLVNASTNWSCSQSSKSLKIIAIDFCVCLCDRRVRA